MPRLANLQSLADNQVVVGSGNGGSINYIAIFESPQWLHEHIGSKPAY